MIVQAPDNKTIDFGNLPPDQVQAAMQKLYPPQSTIDDITKSGLTGIGQGTVGMATLPFDLGSMAGGALARKAVGNSTMGITPGSLPDKALQYMFGSSNSTDAPSITRPIEQAVGLTYEPKTTSGEYARTIGNFVPATMTGAVSEAPSLIEAMKLAAKRSVLSGAGAETANQMGLGPVGQIIGALAGNAAGNSLSSVPQGLRTMGKGIMAESPENLQDIATSMKSNAGGLYQKMRETGTLFTQDAAQELKNKINTALQVPSFIPDLNPNTVAVVKKISDVADNGYLDLGSLDQYRRMLGKFGATEDGVSAGSVKKAIDSFVNGANENHIDSGNTTGIALLNQGRAAYANAARYNDIADVVAKANGDPNRLKAGLQKFLSDRDNTAGWSDEHISALKDAANYSIPERLLKAAGAPGIKIMGKAGITRSAFPLAVQGESYNLGNPLLGAAIVGGGTAAEAARTYIARGKAQKVLDLFQQMKTNGAFP